MWLVRTTMELRMFDNRPVVEWWSAEACSRCSGPRQTSETVYVCLGACSVEMRSLQEVCDSSFS